MTIDVEVFCVSKEITIGKTLSRIVYFRLISRVAPNTHDLGIFMTEKESDSYILGEIYTMKLKGGR